MLRAAVHSSSYGSAVEASLHWRTWLGLGLGLGLGFGFGLFTLSFSKSSPEFTLQSQPNHH